MVAAAAYGTVGQSDHYTYTGTYTLTVGVMTMYAASTATFQSEQAGTIVDVYYSDLSQSFTVSIDGAAAVTVPAGGGTNAIKRYRVTGLADTTHSVKVTASTNWTYLCAIAVNRAAGVAVHNIAWGGGRAAGGGTGLSWTDTSAAANIQAFRKGAMDVSGYTPDLVVVSLGANDVNANDTPANIIAALTTIKGWYPNSDYLFMLWPGISTMAAGAWDAFCAALYSFADTQDIPIMDFRDRSGTVTEALALGLIGADNIHPTEGTQREWGRIIASAYAGSGVSPVLATPSGATAATDVPEGTVLVEYTTP
jgi:lysophospholipase L1-like esterase